MLYNAAIVLEGGAMRGQFTAGVLDCLLEHHVEFSSVIGVSAGAMCGGNYVSKQYGRVNLVNTNYRHDRDYISIRRGLKRNGEILDLNFLFQDHGWNWNNFDERSYERSASHFTVVATSLKTGKAALFTDEKNGELVKALKASSSIPLIAQPQATKLGLCLDGGIADSIPYDVAQKQGFDKIIIVRTRETSYRKKPTSGMLKRLYRHEYKDYPNFVKAAIDRPAVYNHQCDTIDQAVANGSMFCIAPEEPVKVGRLEGNVKKLEQLHETGHSIMERQLPAMLKYLEKK